MNILSRNAQIRTGQSGSPSNLDNLPRLSITELAAQILSGDVTDIQAYIKNFSVGKLEDLIAMLTNIENPHARSKEYILALKLHAKQEQQVIENNKVFLPGQQGPQQKIPERPEPQSVDEVKKNALKIIRNQQLQAILTYIFEVEDPALKEQSPNNFSLRMLQTILAQFKITVMTDLLHELVDSLRPQS